MLRRGGGHLWRCVLKRRVVIEQQGKHGRPKKVAEHVWSVHLKPLIDQLDSIRRRSTLCVSRVSTRSSLLSSPRTRQSKLRVVLHRPDEPTQRSSHMLHPTPTPRVLDRALRATYINLFRIGTVSFSLPKTSESVYNTSHSREDLRVADVPDLRAAMRSIMDEIVKKRKKPKSSTAARRSVSSSATVADRLQLSAAVRRIKSDLDATPQLSIRFTRKVKGAQTAYVHQQRPAVASLAPRAMSARTAAATSSSSSSSSLSSSQPLALSTSSAQAASGSTQSQHRSSRRRTPFKCDDAVVVEAESTNESTLSKQGVLLLSAGDDSVTVYLALIVGVTTSKHQRQLPTEFQVRPLAGDLDDDGSASLSLSQSSMLSVHANNVLFAIPGDISVGAPSRGEATASSSSSDANGEQQQVFKIKKRTVSMITKFSATCRTSSLSDIRACASVTCCVCNDIESCYSVEEMSEEDRAAVLPGVGPLFLCDDCGSAYHAGCAECSAEELDAEVQFVCGSCQDRAEEQQRIRDGKRAEPSGKRMKKATRKMNL